MATKNTQGQLYELSAQFAADLEAGQMAAADQILGAWTDSYWAVRQDMDALLAKVAEAKALGKPTSPAWLYQQQRLKVLLDTTKTEMAKYAQHAAQVTTAAQSSAVTAALKHAEKLAKTAMAETLGTGLDVGFLAVGEDVLRAQVGFLADGSPLADLLTQTMPSEAAQNLRGALTKGTALGWSQDRMLREATAALGLSHTRATTILRTESLRSYRAATRATYRANAQVLGGWVWNAHLDARTCLACAVMDGTEHPVDAILDGHPRCRCAMVPRTKTWDEILGKPTGLPDTRPPVRSGKAWLEAQPPHVQRALMGPGKFDAWTQGLIGLDDMVARTYHPRWGTMRTERSLKAIAEDRNANWLDVSTTPPPAVKPPPPAPNKAHVLELANDHDLAYLQEWAANPAGNGPQALADLHAAIAYKLNRGPVQGPALPRPNQAKVDAAVVKLENAVWSKGYPSKGYSQVKAIYKAQANGTPGTQVGVVKSLTWEQKLTAQAVLDAHDNALPGIVQAYRKQKLLDDAHDQALALNQAWDQAQVAKIAKAADAAAEAKTKALNQALYSLGSKADPHGQWKVTVSGEYLAAQEAVDDAVTALDKAVAQAQLNAVETAMEAYDDAHGFVQANYQGTTWKPKGTSHELATWDDGAWLVWEPTPGTVMKFPAVSLKPGSEFLDKWEQVVVPDPVKVKAQVQGMLDADGYVDPDMMKLAEDLLSSGGGAPQAQANLAEAVAQVKATGKWKAEQHLVDQFTDSLGKGYVTADELEQLAYSPTTQPGTKASILEAVAQYEAAQLAKAAIPVPKPVVNWAKVQWDKVSPKQVDTIKAKVGSGEWTLDDVYAKYQASKNSGPKANYAQAIADLEHLNVKPAPTPTPTPKPTPTMPSAPPWKPEDLTFTGQTLGTHGAQVWKAPDGTRWLFKPPKNPADQFLVTLDEAASQLQAKAGLKAPDTFIVDLGGKRGSIQRMFDSSEGFPGGFKPTELKGPDLAAVQREHVLDWLLSNHDGHRDQFLRLNDGTLVGIDKGQAFRWFGQDRLDWDFHPNGYYGTPEPVYNTLWRAFAQGKDVEIDRHALEQAIADIQAIGDDELRRLLRPYAEQAAARGLLAKAQPSFPGVTKGTVPANNVEAFLDAVVARKNNLGDDFQQLYDKAAKARATARPGWTPAATKPVSKASGKAAWVGKDKPTPPPAPQAPAAAVAADFDPWLTKVKDKYAAFSGKSLEASNNWARVRRVIDDRDRVAVQELLDRHYLDADLATEALDLIAKAEAKVKALEAAHKKALAAHAKAMDAYKRDLGDWKDANGITDLAQGMDDGVVRHSTNPAGVTWAQKHFDEKRYTPTQRKWLKSYTGSAYSSWNDHLRSTKGKPTQYADAFAQIDKAMEAQPIPEDVILHRGTVADGFTLNGQPVGAGSDLTQLVGSVQVDWGYMSTSVGNTAAFSHMPVQLKIRAPAGTPGSYVQMFSNYSTERELILARGTHMYVHNAYKKGGTWFVEVEVVPDDFDPTNATPAPSAKPWSS